MRSFVDQANCNEIELDLEDESNRTYLGKNTPMEDHWLQHKVFAYFIYRDKTYEKYFS